MLNTMSDWHVKRSRITPDIVSYEVNEPVRGNNGAKCVIETVVADSEDVDTRERAIERIQFLIIPIRNFQEVNNANMFEDRGEPPWGPLMVFVVAVVLFRP